MNRLRGPYFVDGSGFHGQGHDDDKWMTYLIDTFLKPGAVLARELASPETVFHLPVGYVL